MTFSKPRLVQQLTWQQLSPIQSFEATYATQEAGNLHHSSDLHLSDSSHQFGQQYPRGTQLLSICRAYYVWMNVLRTHPQHIVSSIYLKRHQLYFSMKKRRVNFKRCGFRWPAIPPIILLPLQVLDSNYMIGIKKAPYIGALWTSMIDNRCQFGTGGRSWITDIRIWFISLNKSIYEYIPLNIPP